MSKGGRRLLNGGIKEKKEKAEKTRERLGSDTSERTEGGTRRTLISSTCGESRRVGRIAKATEPGEGRVRKGGKEEEVKSRSSVSRPRSREGGKEQILPQLDKKGEAGQEDDFSPPPWC